VQAHTLGEVGNLGTVSLRVSSGTVLPIFIEIGSYLIDKEQKISWHSFLRHGVHTYIHKSCAPLTIKTRPMVHFSGHETFEYASFS